jgi:hypothetical protein
MRKKVFLILLTIFSGLAHAANDGAIVLRNQGRSFALGYVVADVNGRGPQVVLRAASGVDYCRDVSFDVRMDGKKTARIEYGAGKWIYRFSGLKGGDCGDERRGGYFLDFSLSHETDMEEVDMALETMLGIASKKPISSSAILFDDARVLECVFQREEWRFSEIYNDFGKKMDDNGNEMGQRMPSVVFHLVSDDVGCGDAYVIAFFPNASKKTYFFVTSAAALPL